MVSIAIITVLQSTSMPAQSLGGFDLTQTKVDDLTDDQIISFVRQVEERGLTQTQVERLARQRGVSESEIAKLRRRIEALNGTGASTSLNSSTEVSTKRTLDNAASSDVFGTLAGQMTPVLSDGQKRIFGFEVFRKNGLTFAPNINLPTPENYQLGPGDELIVDLWGSTQKVFRFKVSPEGSIRPDNLGPIYVNGLSIQRAEKRVIDRLSQIYGGLKGNGENGPTIFSQMSLGAIRTISVDVIGDVARPSLYALPSLATVYTALHAAGGPTENGTFREIRLVRDNKLISTIDVYSFLAAGIRSGDQRLRNGDVIIVKPYLKRIDIRGEVRTTGLIELKKDETFSDLLRYAGGFKNTAFKSLVTVRRNGIREREIIDVQSDFFDVFQPEDGDVIEVSAILNRFANRVTIDGAVFREGEYQLTEGLTLKKLINKAGNLRGDAFMSRATIYRTNNDLSQTTIPVDLEALLNDLIPDIPLLKEDVVRIASIYDLKEESYVQISGEVMEAGVFPFFQQMTVQDLIVLSGGLKESASGAHIEISRRNTDSDISSTAQIITLSIDGDLSLKTEDSVINLQPFDQIYIRRSPGYSIQEQVKIEGEVMSPGEYTIRKKDERISDLLLRANGLTPYAYPEGAILIRKTEFSTAGRSDQINQTFLQEIRQKVLSDQSQLKSKSRTELIQKLDKIQGRVSTDNGDDRIGSAFKKRLIENTSEQDSLVRNLKIEEEEPVALNLENILKNPESKYDFILRPGDVISIPGKLETVRVAGEVTSPLNIGYDKSFKFKDYVARSGGFLISARSGRSYVLYPNGERKGVKRFLWFKKYPKIQPGSTIFIGSKVKRQRIDAQTWIGFGSTLATIGLIAVQIVRSNN